MRENRPYGSEGGESGSTGLPYPYPWEAATVAGMLRCGVCHSSRHTPLCRLQGFALQRIESSQRHMECAYYLGKQLEELTVTV